MKIKINHCKFSPQKLALLIIVLFTLISCKEDFKVYSLILNPIEINNLENSQYINEIDFRYLKEQNSIFNKLIFTLKPLDSIFTNNQTNYKLDRQKDVDIWISYKDKKYKSFQKFLSIYEMYEGRSFTVECGMEVLDKESELYSFFEQFDQYNRKERIELLKQELPKIKLYVSLGDEIVELEVTSKTKAVYTKVPNHMKNIISITYD
ncbi:hypothetical protein [Myroides odoratus]|uniref:hypothetical protein n=1 Tax=Myroides odoratus TaxID=256 RepID=UPI0039AF863D